MIEKRFVKSPGLDSQLYSDLQSEKEKNQELEAERREGGGGRSIEEEKQLEQMVSRIFMETKKLYQMQTGRDYGMEELEPAENAIEKNRRMVQAAILKAIQNPGSSNAISAAKRLDEFRKFQRESRDIAFLKKTAAQYDLWMRDPQLGYKISQGKIGANEVLVGKKAKEKLFRIEQQQRFKSRVGVL